MKREEENKPARHDVSKEELKVRRELQEIWGARTDVMEKNGDLERLFDGRKTGIVSLFPSIGGRLVPMQAKLELRRDAKGEIYIYPHTIRSLANLKSYRNIRLTLKDRENLIRYGHLGRTIEVMNQKTMELETRYLSRDPETNELLSVNVRNVNIPDRIRNIALTLDQKRALEKGQRITLSGLADKEGRQVNAIAQVSAITSGISFTVEKNQEDVREVEREISYEREEHRSMGISNYYGIKR